jgi:para-aminobenzoate synthetase component 1
MKALKKGECYQLNLTSRYHFLFKGPNVLEKMNSRFFSTEHLGQMSHITHIPSFNLSLFSNSPECLFRLTKNKSSNKYFIDTFPIKGTARLSQKDKISSIDLMKLKTEKNKTELRIITDLMRNDLTKVTLNRSEVIENERVLKVPKLIHLYSMVRAECRHKTSLLQIMQGLFPGGSITGAPKKRVLQLISEIENGQRALYTGSTLLWDNKAKIASINIRTLELDTKSWQGIYGSGGGITLGSDALSEFNEMNNKVDSFTSNFFH